MTVFSLFELLQKDVTFQWTDKHQKAFDETKQLFDENVILKFLDLKKPYILTTDASKYAIVANLISAKYYVER